MAESRLRVTALIELLKLLPGDAWVCIPDYTGCGCEPDGTYSVSQVKEETDSLGRCTVIIR